MLRPDTVKPLEENIGRTLLDMNHSNIFLNSSPRWSGLPFPSPGYLPDPGLILHWQVDSLPLSHQGSPQVIFTTAFIVLILIFIFNGTNFSISALSLHKFKWCVFVPNSNFKKITILVFSAIRVLIANHTCLVFVY